MTMKNVQRAAWGEILGQLFERFYQLMD